MAVIDVDYGALASGHDGLVATWQRIETHLADLDHAVAAGGDMQADALTAYRGLRVRWTRSAAERQQVLRMLGDLLRAAADHYRQVDAALAAQFS
ncbi:WXG100 family type VII secretion target [Nakamurella endophytica]|uniref:Uncharacterized protein n=1 Tax=Nakamurella endophytica TaxID=1748367 RepID=A0A917T599_9ACTN|nr:WXG100 family type VII secretion target [Nakamurella endophytica]GGM08634.1 hypothetical protein GCM10011594_30690 [Nakamurella endophytica]